MNINVALISYIDKHKDKNMTRCTLEGGQIFHLCIGISHIAKSIRPLIGAGAP